MALVPWCRKRATLKRDQIHDFGAGVVSMRTNLDTNAFGYAQFRGNGLPAGYAAGLTTVK